MIVRRRNHGYSLIEMLGFTAMLAVLLNLGVGAFLSTSRAVAVGQVATDNLDAINAIRRDFVNDVRIARGILPRVGDYTTGQDTLVIEVPPREGERRRAVLWRRLAGESFVARRVLVDAGDGELVEEHLMLYSRPFDTVRFTLTPGDTPDGARLITLTLVAPEPKRGDRPAAEHRICAALRVCGTEAAP
ncbi:MAG TPA: hypothetical protein PLO37_02860 [Candidatus Hydrogenedentes bacterium]|nr:hypothetical protein [Candidatus Hydrogenedentota bacterium]HPG65761.1 hypothetical protein [Candidatus Hydrogenedentota bacterium]